MKAGTHASARAIASMAVAVLCVACEAETPAAPTLADPLPEMPADHPPMNTMAVPAVPRLAAATVMAQVDGQSITAGDLDAALGAAPGEVRYEFTAPDAVAELVQSLIDRKLMAAAARRAGLAETPEMKDLLATNKSGGPPADYLLAEAWLDRELSKLPPPPAAEVARYYREHQADFTEPQRVFVTRVVADSETAAERVRITLTKGATLSELQTNHSGEILSVDQIWLQDAPRAPQLTEAALSLEPGGVSLAQSVGNDFVLLRAEQKRARRLRPLTEVHAGILATLNGRARDDAMAAASRQLRQNVRVTLHQDAIDSYSSAAVPGIPRPADTTY